MKIQYLGSSNDSYASKRRMRGQRIQNCLWLLPCAFLFSASAQYTIEKSVIGSGGGTSLGGPYSLNGTVGQSSTDLSSGGNFKVQGGFWSVLSETVIPGDPEVTVRILSNGSVQICWPLSATGFALEETAILDSSAWSPSLLAPTVEGTMKCLAIPAPTGNRFYRLAK
jgi:hypothetical protein